MTSQNVRNEWITRRFHFQVSQRNVLPVIFRAKRKIAPKSESESSSSSSVPVPPAFPDTEIQISDSLDVVKEWLIEHADRIYRERSMNLRPGSLETPDVLQNGKHTFTIWFEPSVATFALVTPINFSTHQQVNRDDSNDPLMQFDAFTPTPQTLQIVAEVDG